MLVFIERVCAILAVCAVSSASILETSVSGSQSVSEIPLLGFGTWNVKGNTSDVVAAALKTGFRHIDAAKIYGNQIEVGKGIKQGLSQAGLEREDIWVTSKLWNDQ